MGFTDWNVCKGKKIVCKQKTKQKLSNFITDIKSQDIEVCKNAFWIIKIWGQVDNLLLSNVLSIFARCIKWSAIAA